MGRSVSDRDHETQTTFPADVHDWTEDDWHRHSCQQRISFPVLQFRRYLAHDPLWHAGANEPDAAARSAIASRYSQRGRARLVITDWLDACHAIGHLPPVWIYNDRFGNYAQGDLAGGDFYDRVRWRSLQFIRRANGRCIECDRADRLKTYGSDGRARTRLCDGCEQRLFNSDTVRRARYIHNKIEPEFRRYVLVPLSCCATRQELRGSRRRSGKGGDV
jgi:hypothetical protein